MRRKGNKMTTPYESLNVGSLAPKPREKASLDGSSCYAAGVVVEICDHSEAHGDKGTVLWTQADGLIIVELEGGACWPVTADELKPRNAEVRRPETKP
jgi:hypothetical protein